MNDYEAIMFILRVSLVTSVNISIYGYCLIWFEKETNMKISETLTDKDVRIVVGELTLRELEQIYSQRKWKHALSPKIVGSIIREILKDVTLEDLEIREETENDERYAKLLRIFGAILKDYVCTNGNSISPLLTKEEFDAEVDHLNQIVRAHHLSFQLAYGMKQKIGDCINKELGIIDETYSNSCKVRESEECIEFDVIVKEIKPKLRKNALKLVERYHPILLEEKHSLIEDATDKRLDRFLELYVKNAKKSIEYGYLKHDSQKIKCYIYDAVLESIE
jgi:predicted nucleic acid-binding protein